MKAYIKDLKAWRTSCGQIRQIPFMYTAQELGPMFGKSAEETIRLQYDFLSCGDQSTSIDMFGFNVFRWCSTQCMNTPDHCGMDPIKAQFENNLRIPILLTEYVCVSFDYATKKRVWNQVDYYYTNGFMNVFSGGSAYSYSKGQEPDVDFSFFTGGDPALRIPGTQKTCDPLQPNICNVDNYGTKLTGITAAANAAPISTIPAGTLPQCPVIPGITNILPVTRQGANGYINVVCPNGNVVNPPSTTGGASTGGSNNNPPPSPGNSNFGNFASSNSNFSSFSFIAFIAAIIAALTL
jgi:hypothetical protein